MAQFGSDSNARGNSCPYPNTHAADERAEAYSTSSSNNDAENEASIYAHVVLLPSDSELLGPQKSGGADGTRTRDPLLAKQVLLPSELQPQGVEGL